MDDIKRIEELCKVLVLLQETSSRTLKEEILSKNLSDDYFRETIKFVINPYVVSNIADKKLNKKISQDEVLILENEDYIKFLEKLKLSTGKDSDVSYVQQYIAHFNNETQKILRKIATKNLKLGITSKTVNKIEPGLIPGFGVMLAESYEKNIDKLIGQEVIVTLKLDGTRIIAIKENNDSKPKFYSRQGQIIEGLIEIEEEFEKMPKGIYDGELIALGNFETSKEKFQATMQRSRVKGIKKGLKMVCFDYIEDISSFNEGVDITPCFLRKSKLRAIVPNGLYHIEYLKPLYEDTFDSVVLDELMKDAIKNNEEGLMVNIATAPYECKRTKNLLKVKEFYTVDLKITGVQEGTNKNIGKLGALIVDYKGHEVKVGSGFTDTQREKLWEMGEKKLVGNIVEVRFFEETHNQDGGTSLRFPTFIRLRLDKDEVSYN